MVQLDKGVRRNKFKMNRWVQFFLADALISVGAWAANSGYILLGTFGLVGGIGTITAMIFDFLNGGE